MSGNTRPSCFARSTPAKPFSLFVLASLVLLSLPALFGQSLTTGSITGTVKDQSGAAVPGAIVTLNNVSSGTTQTAT
ncbi:MAG: carboxypeptidase regulatory-like domain-containing protein, partial [Acidobacteriaceae bacterium]|nr:carboxypeptidase regulatory-like domain-containing protein [Acidobacteriaceae bacterium]